MIQIPEFKYVQEEAEFRLKIKRDLSRMGLKLDTNLRNTLKTEELLELKDKMENVKNAN
jgi:hypothetical protein